ncbi:PREDICTED: probably inactive leucine-rich repeat receptor-like protein kinase At3g28040 [Tarenaya hassleriana]|uniref:probably inactive leucine-rich repeat receptor-like protein kinase At3g28040 n=1 Tax=Tarenaya hassleriana TaxID=28532 RepID=UPI00053C6C19|nr:PREDICTED: probably inactive leucine-rich repeat receptor-like protein kinase At3g28040 [Tarenaya hassleriana]
MMGNHSIGISWVFLAVSIVFVNGDAGSFQLNDDVLGLIVFKADINDPSSHLESWNEDDYSPCSWKYIKCNPATGRVSEISLDGLGLSGKIGRGVQKLQHLKVLSLSDNNFTGNIIPQIGLITGLQKLNLSHNRLSGIIPSSLGSISSLKFLDLSENSLSGTIPDDFFRNNSPLRYLSLAKNMLEGPIPSSLARCSLLNTLNLSSNRFSGNPSFVSGIWTLQRLRTLDLSNNSLSGLIPSGIPALQLLKVLHLRGNKFSGPLPADIGFCPHLKRLDLSYNLFSGEVPSPLQRLNSLMFFSLSNNVLSGDFPQWITSLSSLEHLDLSNNALSGELPSSMGNLRSLKHLVLSKNQLKGEIPASLAYCTELSVIQLKGNSFTGSVPAGFFDLGLEEIDFSHNALTGSLPRGSSRIFESLRVLDLSRNNLGGSIPGEVGLFIQLRYLNLSWNDLQTRIPPELGFLQNLTVLDLRNSALTGSVPADICESQSLQILQLDGNSLIGPIPEGIGNCSSLNLLSLSHNNLIGQIPKSLSNLRKLKILKLEVNDLRGEIPPELGKLQNLLAVNFSFNHLVGRLPVGNVFESLDQSALQGNLGICSPLLKGPCTLNVPKPLVIDPNAYGNNKNHTQRDRTISGSGRSHHGMFLSVSVIVAISAAILITSGVIIITLLNASVRRRLAFVDNALESIFSGSSRSGSVAAGKLVLFNSRSSSSSLSSTEFSRNPEFFLNKATEIGEGVFGTVYKAPLGERGSFLAVKKLVPSTTLQNPEDFDREVRILSKVKDENLVLIKGYFWTPDLQLLVSDYVPNGNLQSKLHERNPTTPPLSWSARFRIILGTAKGLAYLHHSCRPPIVHFNLKPTNILFDENNNPKISDFGLTRLLTKHDRNMMNSRFQNALGYIAPELECQSLRVNEKCDVYGFGVLILELVTGRRPVEYGEDSFVILSDHVRVLLEQGNVLECVDPTMDEYSEDEVLPVLKLALVCTSQIPSNRPTMAEIVQILQVIKTPVPQRLETF